MFRETQTRPWPANGQANNGNEENEPSCQTKDIVPKPKTRRGGMRVRARAARRAQRVALEGKGEGEEEQKGPNLSNQASAEATTSITQLDVMQTAPHVKTTSAAITEATLKSTNFTDVQPPVCQYNSKG